MAKHLLKALFSLFFLALILSSTLHCKKKPSHVGLEVQPQDSEMDFNYDDSTVTVSAYTVKRDSVNTTKTKFLVLGSLNDPNFGSTQAAFNTNFRLESTTHDFGTDPTLDSLYLYLPYAGIWGDTAVSYTISVYELKEQLIDTSERYTATTITEYYEDSVIGVKTCTPSLTDSVVVGGKKFPLLAIKLNNSFGARLFEDKTIFKSDQDFSNKFYGVRVEVAPVTGSGNMVYLNPVSAFSKLTMYYSVYSEDTTHRSFSLNINEKCMWYNNYSQEFTNPDLLFDIDSQQDSTSAKERLYLQPFIGTRICLDFKGFEQLRKRENSALNEVKIVFSNALTPDSHRPTPKRVLVYAEDEEGKLLSIADAFNNAYFDGNYDEDRNQYTIRMTRYFQQRILNPVMDDKKLYLQILGGAYQANNVVLKGNDHIPVRIYYTEY